MPLKWVEPDVFFEHLGVTIYNTYNDNNYDDPSQYWFTTDETENEGEGEFGFEFDIREIKEELNTNISAARDPKLILRMAIEEKILHLPDGVEYSH